MTGQQANGDRTAALRQALGDRAVDDPLLMQRHLADWSGDHRGEAIALIRPRSVAEVQDAVRACSRLGVAILTQGGNSGLVAGGVRTGGRPVAIISLERLDAVRRIDADNFSVAVDAGCTLQKLKDACEAQDLYFPLALGAQASCQIGGNVATNAGGVNVLRYGMARDLVLGVEMVTADGEVLDLMSALRKDNRGYDLKQLVLGSEGTLGVITGVELKLFPRPAQVETAWIGVADFSAAMRLFAAARRGLSDMMTAFEVIGDECLPLAQLIDPAIAAPVEAPVHVLVESSSGPGIELGALLQRFLEGAVDAGLAIDAVPAQSLAHARRFWSIREALVEGQARRGYHVRTDLSVRVSDFSALVDAARALVTERHRGWTTLAYGHAGDGNLHFNVLPPRDMAPAEARRDGAGIEKALYDLAVARGGSYSAEHGIGRTRRDYFWSKLPPARRRLLRAVKDAFDPDGLFNPGCLIPEPEQTP